MGSSDPPSGIAIIVSAETTPFTLTLLRSASMARACIAI